METCNVRGCTAWQVLNVCGRCLGRYCDGHEEYHRKRCAPADKEASA